MASKDKDLGKVKKEDDDLRDAHDAARNQLYLSAMHKGVKG